MVTRHGGPPRARGRWEGETFFAKDRKMTCELVCTLKMHGPGSGQAHTITPGGLFSGIQTRSLCLAAD